MYIYHIISLEIKIIMDIRDVNDLQTISTVHVYFGMKYFIYSDKLQAI